MGAKQHLPTYLPGAQQGQHGAVREADAQLQAQHQSWSGCQQQQICRQTV